MIVGVCADCGSVAEPHGPWHTTLGGLRVCDSCWQSRNGREPESAERPGDVPSPRARTTEPSELPSSPLSESRCALPCASALPCAAEGSTPELADHPHEVADALGMEGTRDAACPLPEHTGLARLEIRSGGLRLACECEQGSGWTSLADALEAIERGGPVRRRMSRGARWLWTLLLAHRAGLLEPTDVHLGELPPDATSDMRAVAVDMRLLLGLRRAGGDERPLPYSCRFAAQRCGLTKEDASRAIRALEAAGVVECVGDEPSPGHPRPLKLYAAPAALRPRLSGRVEAAASGGAAAEGSGTLGGLVTRDLGEVLTAQPVGHVQDDALVAGAEPTEGLRRLSASVSGATALEHASEVALVHAPNGPTVSGVSGVSDTAEADRR